MFVSYVLSHLSRPIISLYSLNDMKRNTYIIYTLVFVPSMRTCVRVHYTCVCLCICVCVCVRVHREYRSTCVCVCLYVCLCRMKCACIYVRMRVRVCVHIRVGMLTSCDPRRSMNFVELRV